MLGTSLLLASTLLAAAASAQEPGSSDWPLVPGLMGYNALPVLPNVDPAVGTLGELELGAAAQTSGLDARDHAATPYVRLMVPFRETAALELDAILVEIWRTSAATQQRLAALHRAGGTSGDIRFGARFLLFRERRLPSVGLRLTVKSTTGKGLTSRRFTNAPGYAIDALFGKEAGEIAGTQVRALARVGFLAWQFAQDRQDDAFAYGLGLRATRASGLGLELDWRGYLGWRFADRPSVLGLTGVVPMPAGELKATLNAGLNRDAPPMEVRIGWVGRFELPGALRGD